MLLADVNVFLYAHRRESARHDDYRAWLEDRLSGTEPFGVSELVLSSFVRIVTNRRVYLEPATPSEATAFCHAVLTAQVTVPLRPGRRHWGIFAELIRTTGARANVVPDAFLAALALEHGATWVTDDGGYRRFPGLTVRRPLED